MFRVAWRNLQERKGRMVMSFLAIVMGVGFVSGSLMFVSTLDRALLGVTSSRVADVMVRTFGDDGSGAPTGALDAKVLPVIKGVDGVAAAHGRVWSTATFVIDRDGTAIGSQGQPAIGMNFFEAPAAKGLPGPRLVSGREPRAEDEVTLDPSTAKKAGYTIGDTVTLSTDGSVSSLSVEVVGFADFGGSAAGGSVVMFSESEARTLFVKGKKRFHDVWVVAEDGGDQIELMRDVAAVLPTDARAFTGQRAAKQAASALQQNLGFLTAFLLLFSAISLAVGSFLIMNTFSILVAQRTRELALMRAMGASRVQVTSTVLVEAFLVSLIGSILGVIAGWLVARVATFGVGFFGPDLAGTPLAVSGWMIAAAIFVGVGVTVVSGLVPAIKAASVPPMVALQGAADPGRDSMVGRGRAGWVLVVFAAIFLWFSTGDSSRTVPLGIGAVLLVLGAIAWAPILVTPILRVLRPVFTVPFGVVGFLARRNTLRHPRRTAATASALTIGVTLVSMMTVFGESAKASVDSLIEDNFSGDFVVFNPVGAAFAPTIADEVSEVAGVKSTARLRYSGGYVGTRADAVAGVDPIAFNKVVEMDLVDGRLPREDFVELMVQRDRAEEQGLSAGDRIRVTAGGAPVVATVSGIYEKNPAVLLRYIGSLRFFDEAGGQPKDQFLYIQADPGAPIDQVRAKIVDVLEQAPAVTVEDREEFAAAQRAPIVVLLTLIQGLLALALLIAVLGIVNTLGLAVSERTREIGMLRSMGLTMRQVKMLIRIEAAAIAVLGALLGVAAGVVLGVTLQASQADAGITVLVLPWAWLAGYVVIAAVVGVFAAWVPARRAAHLPILEALRSE